MGVYGSPELGPYAEPEKPIKKEGYKPQKNIWVWAAILVLNIVILLIVGVTLPDVITILALDSIILFGISAVSLIVNIVQKRKVGNDVKFIFISVIAFFILIIILGTL